MDDVNDNDKRWFTVSNNVVAMDSSLQNAKSVGWTFRVGAAIKAHVKSHGIRYAFG